jgi:hypothetical protein
MKAQPHPKSAPSATKRWPVRLLLAGDEDELDSEVTYRNFDGSRRVVIARSTSLLGALEHLQTERADVVLVRQTFRDEEVAAFLSNARRAGFEGLILRVASATVSTSAGSASSAVPGSSSTVGFRNTSVIEVARQNEIQRWRLCRRCHDASSLGSRR